MENIVGKNIKRYRIMRNLTQKQLAELMGYNDRSTIAKIETGVADIYLDTVKSLRRYLVSPQCFLWGSMVMKLRTFCRTSHRPTRPH